MSFTQEEKDEWFLAIENDDTDTVNDFLTRGFDPDARDESGDNGLTCAALKDSYEVMPILLEALKRKYAHDPVKLIAAIGYEGITKGDSALRWLDASDSGEIGIIEQIKDVLLPLLVDRLKRDFLFTAITGDELTAVEREDLLRGYLDRGFDPDTRDKDNKNALDYAAENGRTELVLTLIQALEDKYIDDPDALIESMDYASGRFTEECDEDDEDYPNLRAAAHRIEKSIAAAQEKKAAMENGTFVSPPRRVRPSPQVSGASTDPSVPAQSNSGIAPVTLDRTLTLSRLKETKPGGKTNLEILAAQGKLPEVFTFDIWQGRREEMDQAWELVPNRFRSQIDIELLRHKLSSDESRARFRREDGQMGQGF